MNEFSLIEQFFKPFVIKRNDVVLGIGDDAACVQVPAGNTLLISTDTLVSGVHFLPEWSPYDIACRAVRVNVSDIAAMAALPCWITLAITLPELDEVWLQSFAAGLNASLNEFNIDLIGGNTTRGPLSITITILGLAPEGQEIKRSGAHPGDVILVSGALGAAALAVKFLTKQDMLGEEKTELMKKLLYPKPRIDLMPLLRSYASSAIDISDGLSADLNHICTMSGVGACLTKENIPIHPLLSKYIGDEAIDLALTGGDDYELCFTVPPQLLESFTKELSRKNLVCYPIGVIEETLGLRIHSINNTYEPLKPKGYSHF